MDPASGKTLQRQRVHGCPFFQKNPPIGGFIYASLFCDGGAAQEAGHDDELLKLDARTGKATIVRTTMSISGVEAGTRRLYLFNWGAGQIATFDPATGQVRGVTQAPGGDGLYVTEFDGALWAVLFDQEQLDKYPLPR